MVYHLVWGWPHRLLGAVWPAASCTAASDSWQNCLHQLSVLWILAAATLHWGTTHVGVYTTATSCPTAFYICSCHLCAYDNIIHVVKVHLNWSWYMFPTKMNLLPSVLLWLSAMHGECWLVRASVMSCCISSHLRKTISHLQIRNCCWLCHTDTLKDSTMTSFLCNM